MKITQVVPIYVKDSEDVDPDEGQEVLYSGVIEKYELGSGRDFEREIDW